MVLRVFEIQVCGKAKPEVIIGLSYCLRIIHFRANKIGFRKTFEVTEFLACGCFDESFPCKALDWLDFEKNHFVNHRYSYMGNYLSISQLWLSNGTDNSASIIFGNANWIYIFPATFLPTGALDAFPKYVSVTTVAPFWTAKTSWKKEWIVSVSGYR